MVHATAIAAGAVFAGSALGSAVITPRANWTPAVGASWQIVLDNAIKVGSASLNPNVDIYDIDLFGSTDGGKDDSLIKALHAKGKKVICYFSAGTLEEDRPDTDRFKAAEIGNKMEGWDELWLNTNSQNVRTIMTDRIALAAKMGCDAIDPDNMDAYNENDGDMGKFQLTKEDAISYTVFLAGKAKEKKLLMGLKNAAEIIDDVISQVDFSVNEECLTFKECHSFNKFIKAGKPVFHIEYPNGDDNNSKPVKDLTTYCKSVTEKDGNNNVKVDMTKFSTVIKNKNLDGWVQLCDGTNTVTPVQE